MEEISWAYQFPADAASVGISDSTPANYTSVDDGSAARGY